MEEEPPGVTAAGQRCQERREAIPVAPVWEKGNQAGHLGGPRLQAPEALDKQGGHGDR